MLDKDNINKVDNLLSNLTNEQLIWLNGYIYGKINIINKNNIKTKLDIEKLTIIYATETGNSKQIAKYLQKNFQLLKIKNNIFDIRSYDPKNIINEKTVIFIISTHGDGDLPDNASEFFNYLNRENPDLSKLQYHIIALGDSNYPKFCKAGEILDNHLQKYNAISFLDRVNFDLDFQNYLEERFSIIKESLTKNNKNKKGKIIENIILNDKGSNKEIHHIAIESDLKYSSGDSIAIKLKNERPRLYSISSSSDFHENQIHLTVKKIDNGLCSSFLANLNKKQELNFYLAPNNNFRLPEDDQNIIMICAGTGIAPFRSFLFQREYNNARGKNWLFFGEQYQKTDFLYQNELQEFYHSKLLTKISLAFSRDQEKKIYVQDRIRENALEIKEWVDKYESYIYICGDKNHMAKDVENELNKIIGQKKLKQLEGQNKYLKDIY